jgi:divalent metal cation (Fe/Co/Zn/Cd) transporter
VLRSGTGYVIDIHLEVDADISVRSGHDIAHRLRESLLADPELRVRHVMTHVEPHGRDRSPE